MATDTFSDTLGNSSFTEYYHLDKNASIRNHTGFNENERVQFILKLVKKCFARTNLFHSNNSVADVCPLTFDGYSCWDPTPAGQTAHLPCPSFVTGFDSRRAAYRSCLDNGTWYRHPDSGQEWSNYTTCVDVEDLLFRQLVNTMYVYGYSLSVITLVISLAVFLSFRSLNCTRISIHIQLFVSFAINNVMWIVWYRLVVQDPQVVTQNQVWCQLLHVTVHYFMVSNYMWMFCEGLYLHLALVVVFVKDQVIMRWFNALGWGLPLALVLVYATVRYHLTEDTHGCWMSESFSTWLLTLPVCLSLVANFVFLVNVVRVLITKLHRESVPVGLRKAVRATLLLVPLFGVQHVMLPFRPAPGEAGEKFYQVFSAIVVSLQGLCVSCLFCFANIDVHHAVGRKLANCGPGWESCAQAQENTQSNTQSRNNFV